MTYQNEKRHRFQALQRFSGNSIDSEEVLQRLENPEVTNKFTFS